MAKPVGILGGTFDPVHIGHLRLALEVHQQLGLQEVRLVPVYSPPHREPPVATPEQRLTMLKLGAAKTNGLTVDDVEIRRQGTSYTIDTVKSLRKIYPETPLCLIIGMDQFGKLDTWRDWTSLPEYVHFIIVNRTGANAEIKNPEAADLCSSRLVEDVGKIHDSPAGRIYKIDIPLIEISSTRIRKLVEENKSIKHLTTVDVITYINDESLYQNKI